MPTINAPISYERRMAAAFGLRPASGRCPRRAAGSRCVAWRDLDRPCVCQVHHGILDHVRVWRDTEDRVVVTAEPYGFDPEELTALAADLEPLGLCVAVLGGSQWNPGGTVLLGIVKRDPREAAS